MDYEKKYKEAFERAKIWQKHLYEVGDKDYGDELNYIFPELNESEDERIRKALLELVHDTTGDELWVDYNVHKEDALAWLEKQGKQKLADKIEPKFKQGDWVTNSIETIQITGYDIDYGYQVDYKGNLQHRDTDIIEKEYHLWTIQDAKEGDVLSAYECIVVFKEIDGLNIKCYCTYHYMNNPSFHVDTLQNKTAFHPATKEQRDQLKKAMNDAGYKWDAEKRELIKIKNSNPANVVNEPKLTKEEGLIDKNKLLEELEKLKQNLSASPIVVIEDVESLVESFEVIEVVRDNNPYKK